MSARKTLFMLGLAIIASIFFLNPAMADGLMAGAAVADITPDLGEMKVPSAGYGARGRTPMEGVHDPVKCKALVVSDGVERACLVTCDVGGVSVQVRDMVLADVDDLGIEDRNLMMTASHTHSGPGAMTKNWILGLIFGSYNPDLARQTADRITAAIREADDAMVPAVVRVGVTELPEVVRNRRDPAGSYDYDTRRFTDAYDPDDPANLTDPILTTIRFDAKGMKPIAVIVSFAAHPTVLGADNLQISADWPGAMQRDVEAALPGAVAMFINGAIGDQAPTMHDGDGIGDFEYVEKIGVEVARGAISTMDRLESVSGTPVGAAMARREIPPGNVVMGYKVPRSLVKHYFPEMPLQVIRIGEVALIGAPVEMVAEIGLTIKDGARGMGVKVPIIAGLANDKLAYCVTPDQIPEGGYEVGATLFGEIEAGLIIGEEMMLLRSLFVED